MPVTYILDAQNRMVTMTICGVLTREEVVAYAAAVKNEPAFNQDFSELVDLRETIAVDLRGPDFWNLLSIDPFSPASKRALVVIRHTQPYGMMRMFQTLREGSANIALFETMEAAMEWIR